MLLADQKATLRYNVSLQFTVEDSRGRYGANGGIVRAANWIRSKKQCRKAK